MIGSPGRWGEELGDGFIDWWANTQVGSHLRIIYRSSYLLSSRPKSQLQKRRRQSRGCSEGDELITRGGWGDGGCWYVERPKFEKEFTRVTRLWEWKMWSCGGRVVGSDCVTYHLGWDSRYISLKGKVVIVKVLIYIPIWMSYYISVLNGTPQRPVCPTGHGVHRPGRCTIQIFEHIGEGPVHPTCIFIYRPASAPHTPSTTIQNSLATPGTKSIAQLMSFTTSQIFTLWGNLSKLCQFQSMTSDEFVHHYSINDEGKESECLLYMFLNQPLDVALLTRLTVEWMG